MTDHFIHVEPDVGLFVQDLGSGDPVVLLHGWALGHEVWDRQVYELTRAGRRTISIDLRGHGGSSKPLAGYDVERLAADVIAVLTHLELGPVELVGWSLGGLTAFRIASSRPDLVRRLVLVSSNGVAASRVPGLPFGAAASDVEDKVINAELTDRLRSRTSQIRGTIQAECGEDLIRWLIQLTMRVPVWAGIECLRTVLNTDQVAAAPELAVPLVQIIGDKDPTLSRRASRWLVDTVPDARQRIIQNSGHFPMFEAPSDFTQAVLESVTEK
ncbi:alpha/beta fold hydrolase [Gordonia rubripertincta]|uniref:Alpha/beta hydrolase n=1 Tax=Gordonia rubripertincta TaxID=36822 RepID=A0ABT4MYE5_GORRU|nr:alpha/beta hydrolase [Gordonia rubripertincta]MCZ4551066.1 alpha/beta hydrolase [Gordonia rubripertincta]